MGPKGFSIKGVMYENIGVLTINGHNYIIIRNQNEIKTIEMKNVEGQIKYLFPNVNTNDPQELKSILFCDEICSSLKHNIDNGTFKSKEELQTRINDINSLLTNDNNIKNLFNFSVEEFKARIKGIYEYFDQQLTPANNLNLQNITSFEIEKDGIEKEYIKRTNEDGSVEVLLNRSNKNFVDQFNEAQNELASANTKDGIANANEIYDSMRDYQKAEVNMQNMHDISGAETKDVGYRAMSNYDNQKYNRDIVGSVEDGIYVDTNTGDTMTTVQDGNSVSINKVEEKTAISSEYTNIDNETGEKYDYETPEGIDEESLTEDEIERILLKPELTVEQKNMFMAMLERKREKRAQQGTGLSQDKRLTFNLPGRADNPNDRAAYVNLIVLCLFVQVFLLLGIIAAVYYMK